MILFYRKEKIKLIFICKLKITNLGAADQLLCNPKDSSVDVCESSEP
jgi:hypothetical protein